MSFFLTLECVCLFFVNTNSLSNLKRFLVYIQREKRYMNVAAGERAKDEDKERE